MKRRARQALGDRAVHQHRSVVGVQVLRLYFSGLGDHVLRVPGSGLSSPLVMVGVVAVETDEAAEAEISTLNSKT